MTKGSMGESLDAASHTPGTRLAAPRTAARWGAATFGSSSLLAGGCGSGDPAPGVSNSISAG